MARAGCISVLPCLSLIGRGIADAFVICSSRLQALLEIQQLVLDSQRALPELASFTDQYFLIFFFFVTTPSNRHWHCLPFAAGMSRFKMGERENYE